MKTIVLLIVSSLFLSNMPNNKENDSIKKVMTYKIEKTERFVLFVGRLEKIKGVQGEKALSQKGIYILKVKSEKGLSSQKVIF